METTSEVQPELAKEQATPPASSESSWNGWRILRWVLLGKAVFVLAALACIEIWPLWSLGAYEAMPHWPLTGEATLASRFATWDAALNLELGSSGYQTGHLSCTLFPLYPMIVRITSQLSGLDVFPIGLLWANLLSLMGVVAFHRLAWEMFGTATANAAVALLLTFPGAIFLNFPYAEGLLLVLVSWFFLVLHRNQTWRACLLGTLLAAATPFGLVCMAPLVWHLRSTRGSAARVIMLYAPIGGWLTYYVLLHCSVGSALAGIDLQRSHPRWLAISMSASVSDLFTSYVNIDSAHSLQKSALDRFMFVSFLCLLPFIHRLDKRAFWYAIAAGTLPAACGLFIGYCRHLTTCLPVFLALGFLVQSPARRWVRNLLLTGFVTLQLFFLTRYVNFLWVG